MQYKLRMTGRQHSALSSHLFPGDRNEAVALALCGRRQGKDAHILTVHRIIPIPHEECPVRLPDQITWRTDRIEPLLEEAVKKGMALLKIHSHPGYYPHFSKVDDAADRDLFPTIYSWLDDGLPHMSAIMLPAEGTNAGGEIMARVVTRKGDFIPVNLVSVAGDNLHFWDSDSSNSEYVVGPEEFEAKNRQFFGEETFTRLRQLSVGIVGISGTGSPLVEQLARLGVGHLVLVDPDVVKDKNLNRILNTTRADASAKRLKVEVLADAIRAMDLGTEVLPLPENLVDSAVMRKLAECDVLFGCMDSAEGRYYLNRLATFYNIPYFDLGVRLDADGIGGVSYVCGSVHSLQPDGSSLFGRGMVSMEAVRAEGLARRNPEEYERQRHEGYIRNVHVERPAVITINMQIAAMAANEFLARLHPYRRVDNTSCAIRTFDFRENDHVCEPEGEPCLMLAKFAGRGDARLFLDDPSPEIQ
ncbi:ThiF family adenylyltransferase [Armatimonas sp.]|uniref:HesA/MoeB/ThiF family protein n=1 Tax=Armatimonas sp. TaxID=1872638 RepID=UPI00286B2164|nr:ThiF family adenylyltransferase [Armatimonas sp.]